jgi:hypothetical protein
MANTEECVKKKKEKEKKKKDMMNTNQRMSSVAEDWDALGPSNGI